MGTRLQRDGIGGPRGAAVRCVVNHQRPIDPEARAIVAGRGERNDGLREGDRARPAHGEVVYKKRVFCF